MYSGAKSAFYINWQFGKLHSLIKRAEHDLLGCVWLSEHVSNCLSDFRVCLLPLDLLSLVSVMCPVLLLGSQVLKGTGAEPPAQYTGQVLLLTSLGFSVREGLPTWAAGTSWNKWLKEEKENMKMRLMSEWGWSSYPVVVCPGGRAHLAEDGGVEAPRGEVAACCPC